MSQKVEKVQKGAGEGSALEIKKSTIQNADFWVRGGLYFFPNVNADYKCFSWTKKKVDSKVNFRQF